MQNNMFWTFVVKLVKLFTPRFILSRGNSHQDLAHNTNMYDYYHVVTPIKTLNIIQICTILFLLHVEFSNEHITLL